jgi:subtilisin family serine protease
MATRDTGNKRRPKRRTDGGDAESTRPIFPDPASNIIPGEVLVQLDEGVAGQVTESIPKGPSRGLRATHADAFGIDGLDAALRKIGVTAITRLHPPQPVVSAAMTEAVAMASTFRISFAAKTPVEKAVSTLSATAGVVYAEPNRYRETCVVPSDPSFAAQWGLTKINCPAAWDRTTGSANVTVAVIDTGVDLDHPELAPLLVQGNDLVDLGPAPVPPPGFHFDGDFQGRDNNPQDEVGHGTHVAGTIACLSNNGVGVAGVTWSCRIMPVRVLARIVNNANPADVRGTGSSADIAAGIRWAVDNGARVLNLSLGGPSDTQVERDAIAYAIGHGVVVCAAMGNGGAAAGPSFPGAYPDVVAVGAIDQSDHRAAFSQVGPHIDIVGPGVGVLSTVWDNGFTTMSGTSMATPHVSGVAALVLSCNPGLTGAQVADVLRQTARPLRDIPADSVPNNNYGFGCVDAQAAVNRACPLITRTIACRQTSPIFCRETTPITCRPSTLVRCPSINVACPTAPIICRETTPVTCRQSTLVRCPSISVACPTAPIICRETTPIACRPSAVIPCQSAPITCAPSATIRCPSGPVCGRPDQPIENPLGMGQDEMGGWDDPYGTAGAFEGWDDYDPYAGHYGGKC